MKTFGSSLIIQNRMGKAYELTREVLQQHHEQAFKWAMSCCHYDIDMAREVMQSVYIQILEDRAVFSGRSSLRTWLFSVIRRVAWQYSRSARSVDRLKSIMIDPPVQEYTPAEGPSHIEQNQQVQHVVAAVMELSPQQRHIIELVYYREFTLEEGAKILGISTGSARTHFHRAKQALAQKLRAIRE